MGAVVGVDASIASTGLVVLSDTVSAFQRIQTSERGQDISSRIGRMRESAAAISAAVAAMEPAVTLDVDLVVIEMPAFKLGNAQTHMLAGHWWLVVHALEKFARGRVAQVATGTLKKFATGNGAASKEDVHAAAVAAFPGRVPVSFRAGNDVADASVLASMGAAYLGHGFGGVFAPSGMASVQAVRWPEIRKVTGR